MTTNKRIRVGEVLIDEGILTPEQLASMLEEQKQTGRILGELLVEKEIVTGEQLLSVLSRRLGVKACTLRRGMTDNKLLSLVGEEEALRLNVLPMWRVHDTLTVAMAEPQSLPTIDRLRQLTGCAIRPVLALEGSIVAGIKRGKAQSADMDALMASLGKGKLEVVEAPEDEPQGRVTDLDNMAVDGGPVISLVNMILLKAVNDQASDVHIEPDHNATRIRYRVDGGLREMITPPEGMHPAIVSRVKVIGRMDIAEKRLPQEGRVQIIAEGREIDLRVSSMPTLQGEKLVIRILDKDNLRIRLQDLGFREEALAVFMRILHQPYGLVLVTGPTGSGKTTTLYSALENVKDPALNILTVEDPVEYQLDMVNQIQVQSSIGLTFAKALRSILRQDPDVIMVGEIRDEETARVAVQAALTGHLVLATLHTNSAAGAVARLVDMGVEPYLLSGALNGAVAQRLVRRVCPNCLTTYVPEDNVLRDAGIPDQKGRKFNRGGGCDACHQTGFLRRSGIYEVMEITPELRAMIHRGASGQDLAAAWRRQGGLTLRHEGILLALEGDTSLEEVLAATYSEGEETKEADADEPALVGAASGRAAKAK